MSPCAARQPAPGGLLTLGLTFSLCLALPFTGVGCSTQTKHLYCCCTPTTPSLSDDTGPQGLLPDVIWDLPVAKGGLSVLQTLLHTGDLSSCCFVSYIVRLQLNPQVLCWWSKSHFSLIAFEFLLALRLHSGTREVESCHTTTVNLMASITQLVAISPQKLKKTMSKRKEENEWMNGWMDRWSHHAQNNLRREPTGEVLHESQSQRKFPLKTSRQMILKS